MVPGIINTILFCMANAVQTLETSVGHEAPVEVSLLASLGLNGKSFTYQAINFLLVFLVLWFLILKPLTKKMEERRKLIDDSLAKAREVEMSFQVSQQKFQEKIDEAKVESNAIIAKAHDEAILLSKKLKEQTSAEITKLLEEAKQLIAREKADMQVALREETAELIALALEKIFKDKLTEQKDKAYIKELLKGLKPPSV